MKDKLEKIIERYKEYKIEILLMLLFVCAFFVLNGPQLAREASVLYGNSG